MAYINLNKTQINNLLRLAYTYSLYYEIVIIISIIITSLSDFNFRFQVLSNSALFLGVNIQKVKYSLVKSASKAC